MQHDWAEHTKTAVDFLRENLQLFLKSSNLLFGG